MKPKSKCCKKYENKAKLCKNCPLMQVFSGMAIGQLSKKARKRLAKAA